MAEERVKRRLAAILAADVVGYSRLMGADEAGTLAQLKNQRAELIDPTVAAHDGRIVKLMGDGMLAEFASVVDAVQCAVEIQREMAERNAEVSQDRKIELRIGINLGDVILDGDDIYGDGVNVAARLESLAEPGGICISGAVHDAVGNKLAVRLEFMGEKEMKNIETPVRTYRIGVGDSAPGASVDTPARRAAAAALPRAKRSDGPSLAVRPFENLSGDPEQDHFANSITHGIITALIRVPRLSLIGDESPNLARSSQMTAEDLGRHFDVQFVLGGSIHKLGNRIRVRATLLDVPNSRYLWAEDFDRDLIDLGDLFAIVGRYIDRNWPPDDCHSGWLGRCRARSD